MLARAISGRCLAVLILMGCLPSSAVTPAIGQETTDGKGSFLLGTASTGGTYHPVGVALSTLVKLKLLPEFDVDLTAINTDGSQENIELMRRGDLQFAIVSALAGHDARNGTGPFADVGAIDDLRAITTLWLSTDHLLVRDDSVKSGTVEDFLGLKGRPVSLGRAESGTLLENEMLMSALGVDIDADFDRVELGYGESAEALAAGRIDGMSVSGGVPIGAVQDLFERMGENAAILEINDEQLARIDGRRGLWQRVIIPSGTYPGQGREIFTIGTPNILAVRADVDDEVVYQITRTIFEELDYLHGLHDTTRQINLDKAVTNLPIPVHEGAARYFEEEGVELPLPPVALDPDLLPRYASVDEARAAANQGTVTMYAGTEGDTSTRIAAELASVLDAADGGVRLLATNGGGIGRNLTDLLYLKGVDTAVVRADVLNYAEDQSVYPTVRNQVTYISEMFPEEVHLLVGADIADLDDLTGRTINLGAPGSGTDITASIVLSELGISAETTRFEPRLAIDKLKRGEIAGAFFVGGKPMPLLKQIDAGSGLKLLSLPAIDYADSYRTAEIRSADYPDLLPTEDAPLPTIAVRTALMTYAWRPESPRYQSLADLTGALFDNLLRLHEGGYHSKWLEVDPTVEFTGWRRFEPATLWIDDNQGTARRIAGQGRLRLEEQNALQSGAGGGQPLLIESDPETVVAPAPADAIEVPAEDVAAPAAEQVPATEESTDAAVLPKAPVVGLPPTVAPAANNKPPSKGAALNGSSKAQPSYPSSSFSDVPTTGVNAPTF